MSQLGDALFTTTQKKVLGLLYSQPEKSFYTKQVIRMTGMGVATIKRELDRMLSSGILQMTKIGNQHHYQANPECPIYQELLGIVKKTFGITDVISAVLLPLSNHIDWSFIFGSVASGKESSGSDIDIMVIGDASFSDVVGALYTTQEKLRREINPKIYSTHEWLQLKKNKDTFIQEVLGKPRINIIGDEHEFGKLSRQDAREN